MSAVIKASMARAKGTAPAGSGPVAAETGGTLTVDLAAIVANWQALKRHLLTVECAAVVKANAYGLGLRPRWHTPVARRSSSPTLPKRESSVRARKTP
jgi:hypothetical protein